MKPSIFATCLALVIAYSSNAALASNVASVELDDPSMMLSPEEALEAFKSITLPDGVTLTGTVDPLKQPDDVEKEVGHEQWLGGGLGWGGWGGLAHGGFGGFGPYRFSFMCAGGLGGWAYPLGFWNAFGPGLYGGSCALGFPYGGFYYC